jgi:hypothetical protein
MAYPALMRCLWSSGPVIAGICTSAIKQAVWTRRGDTRKSAADGKISTGKPNDLISLRIDSRKNRSSSTTEISDASGIPPRSSHVPAIRVLQQRRRARTINCAEEGFQAMPGAVNNSLARIRIPSSECQGAAETDGGVRKFSFRPRMWCGGEWGCSDPPKEISYEP